MRHSATPSNTMSSSRISDRDERQDRSARPSSAGDEEPGRGGSAPRGGERGAVLLGAEAEPSALISSGIEPLARRPRGGGSSGRAGNDLDPTSESGQERRPHPATGRSGESTPDATPNGARVGGGEAVEQSRLQVRGRRSGAEDERPQGPLGGPESRGPVEVGPGYAGGQAGGPPADPCCRRGRRNQTVASLASPSRLMISTSEKPRPGEMGLEVAGRAELDRAPLDRGGPGRAACRAPASSRPASWPGPGPRGPPVGVDDGALAPAGIGNRSARPRTGITRSPTSVDPGVPGGPAGHPLVEVDGDHQARARPSPASRRPIPQQRSTTTPPSGEPPGLVPRDRLGRVPAPPRRWSSHIRSALANLAAPLPTPFDQPQGRGDPLAPARNDFRHRATSEGRALSDRGDLGQQASGHPRSSGHRVLDLGFAQPAARGTRDRGP